MPLWRSKQALGRALRERAYPTTKGHRIRAFAAHIQKMEYNGSIVRFPERRKALPIITARELADQAVTENETFVLEGGQVKIKSHPDAIVRVTRRGLIVSKVGYNPSVVNLSGLKTTDQEA
jgi:hypothetical protein